MAHPWFRLWGDMVNDPKFRTIARLSKQEVSRVLAVYLHMMTLASNATERGRTQGWNDEDIATALNIETNDVTIIRETMQGRLIDGDYLTGWEKRQPLREDGSAERGKAFRERKKAEKELNETQPNATEREITLDKIRLDKIRKEKKEQTTEPKNATASRLPADWQPDFSDIDFCNTERPELSVDSVVGQFKDYWIAQPGVKGRKLDWSATWRNWVRNQRPPQTHYPGKPAKFDPLSYVNRRREPPNDRRTERDITAEVFEMVRSPPDFENIADGPPLQTP